MNNYGTDLNQYLKDEDTYTSLLSTNLIFGSLGLMLGAGVSLDLNLPSWKNLVADCLVEVSPGTTIPGTGNSELMRVSDAIKRECASYEVYQNLVRKHLYKHVNFDFSLAKKDLLIALSSLMVGKSRGTVNHVVTYNFDSVLEWYLQTNGLRVNVSTKRDLLQKEVDVEITHIHGYLPHLPEYGADSEKIVLSKEEFEDRRVQYDYWKVVTQDFFRKHLFLTVGLSPASITDDICPYLRELDKWYEHEHVIRDYPYGVSFLVSIDPKTDLEIRDNLIRHGIVPIFMEIPQIPKSIFKISQSALKKISEQSAKVF